MKVETAIKDSVTTLENYLNTTTNFIDYSSWWPNFIAPDYKVRECYPKCPCEDTKVGVYTTYFPSLSSTSIKINYVDSNGTFEMDLPGAEDLKVTTSYAKLKITAVVKGKDYSLEVDIPEEFRGSTPSGSYRKGVLKVEFEPADETVVELSID